MRNGSLAQALPGGIDQAKPAGSGSPSRCQQTIQSLPPCSGPPFASHSSGPPQRASIPVLALEAQPPTGLPSGPTCRGAGPLQVLKTRGFAGDFRQASPVRPVYNADQPITAVKGTGIRTLGTSRKEPLSLSLFGGFGPEVSRLCLCDSLPAGGPSSQ